MDMAKNELIVGKNPLMFKFKGLDLLRNNTNKYKMNLRGHGDMIVYETLSVT